MCNPIMQAKLLNKAKTNLNVVVGLCVGHDSLFYKYANGINITFGISSCGNDGLCQCIRRTGHYCSDVFLSSLHSTDGKVYLDDIEIQNSPTTKDLSFRNTTCSHG